MCLTAFQLQTNQNLNLYSTYVVVTVELIFFFQQLTKKHFLAFMVPWFVILIQPILNWSQYNIVLKQFHLDAPLFRGCSSSLNKSMLALCKELISLT